MESMHLMLFAKTCDNSIRGMFLMKSAIVSFMKSLGTVFVNCSFHCTPQITIVDGGGPYNHDGHMFFKIIQSLNTSYSILMETWVQCAVTLPCWKWPWEDPSLFKCSMKA
jgi:hypothetical protein